MSRSPNLRGSVDGVTPTPTPPLKGEGDVGARFACRPNETIVGEVAVHSPPSPLRGGAGVGVPRTLRLGTEISLNGRGRACRPR